MVEDITAENFGDIANPAFRRHAKMYVDIQADFAAAVAQFGLEREPDEEAFTRADLAARTAQLAERGVIVANDGKSIHVGWISPSCVSCRKGVGTETFLASTQCPRDCYFCFNPNQQDYEYYRSHVHDMAAELQQRFDAGVRLGGIVAKDALAAAFAAFAAGHAAAHGLHADPEGLGLHTLGLKGLCDFVQRDGRVAVLARASVDEQCLHGVFSWVSGMLSADSSSATGWRCLLLDKGF